MLIDRFSLPVSSIRQEQGAAPGLMGQAAGLLKRATVSRVIPAWMVIKSTPSAACLRTILEFLAVISGNSFW